MKKRWIDGAALKFHGANFGCMLITFLITAIWVGLTEDRQFPYLNTALVVTWVAVAILTSAIVEYARRRPEGQDATWGEAMIGATVAFFIMFWVYGVVPHQFLTFADSELNWRSDRLLVGPEAPWAPVIGQNEAGNDVHQGILAWALPLDLTYRVVRDIAVVIIYNMFLALNIAAFIVWQNRGKAAPDANEIEKSRYGRPLQRASVPERVNA